MRKAQRRNCFPPNATATCTSANQCKALSELEEEIISNSSYAKSQTKETPNKNHIKNNNKQCKVDEVRVEEIEALMKKHNDDVDDVKSEDIEEIIEQCNQQNATCVECECLKDNHGVILSECKYFEGCMLELASETQELKNIAWCSECNACIEKNEKCMMNKEFRLLITEYQKDKEQY